MEDFITQESGIYKIECSKTSNKTVYIGSTYSFRNRYYQHFSDLRLGKHKNRHLQNSYNKHGKESFSFEILETVKDNELLEKKEQYWLDYYKTFCNVYNTGVCAKNAFRGVKRPPETIERMKLAHTGKLSKEVRMLGTKAAAEKSRGKKRSQEIKNKISLSKIGHFVSDETKKLIGSKNRGSTRTDEQRKAMSESGKKRWQRERQKRRSDDTDKSG